MNWRSLILLAALTVLVSVGDSQAAAAAEAKQEAAVARITAAEAAKRVEGGKAILIDVREAEEWKETGVAAPAVLLAKSDFDGERTAWERFLKANAGKELILYCRSGRRSGLVATELAAAGWNVSNSGGFSEWKDAGLPTRQPEP